MPLSRVALWVVTLTALGFLAKSWLQEPVTGVWLLAVFVLLVVLVVAGFVFPRWEMFADLLWRGPEDERALVLTFDGVPSNIVRRELLDVLRQHEIRATFFLPSSGDADMLGELAAAGHSIGLLLDSGSSPARMLEAQRRMRSSLGERTDALLPAARPGRWLGPRLASSARKSGLTLVGAATGWPTREQAIASWQLRPGDLIALDASAGSIVTLTSLIVAAADQELSWVALSSWLPKALGPAAAGS
jgi:hypothetical protein